MTNPGTDRTQNRTLHVRFREDDEASLRETLDAVDRGEAPEPHLERVFFHVEDLHRVTRPPNLELLRVIASADPASIRETARLVDRDVRQVHRNLEELADLGLLDFEEDGNARRPVVWYDDIEVHLSLDPDAGVGDHVQA